MSDSDLNPKPASDISASIHFLARIPLYDTVKPFDLSYDPGNGLPSSNFQSELHSVTIRDMRLHNLPYERCGFTYCSLKSAMKYEDYDDEGIIKRVHFPEVQACVKEILGASSVQIFCVSQRRRHASFPVATGETYEHEQPISRAHMDTTLESAKEIIRRGLGSGVDDLFARRWQFVQIWHPRRGPLHDWPLAVCDSTSIDFDADTMPGDSVDPIGVIETVQVQFNKEQRWYYLSGQQHSELLVFKHADSRFEVGVPSGVPHASFDVATSSNREPLFLRESIEMSALAVW